MLDVRIIDSMQRSTGLLVGAFIFSASLALMGVIHFAVRDDRCPSDCRLVPRHSGTPCEYRQCYCPDVDEQCQPTKSTLSTSQRRAMRLLYGFVLTGLGIVIFSAACLCCRADSPTSHINPPPDFPSLDNQANFPYNKAFAYDYVPVTELARRY